MSACISDDVFVVGVLLFFLLVLRRVWLPIIVSLEPVLVWLSLLIVVVLSRPDWFVVGVVFVVLVPEERSAVSSWSWC